MKDYDLLVFLAVFEEMLGLWLYVIPAVAVLVLIALVNLVRRESGIVSKRLVRAEILGFFGGFFALAIMAKVSSSGFTDAGGPADWFLIFGVYGAGLVATTVVSYTLLGFLKQEVNLGMPR